jgi:hypothetical protein
MNLNTFVQQYIPKNYRSLYDFESGLGWIYQANKILRKWAALGYLVNDYEKEVGVEVDKYFWITIPSDCLRVIDIRLPVDVGGYGDKDDELVNFPFEITNGKIKIFQPYEKDDSTDAFTLSVWATTGVSINDTDAAADDWNNYLLVVTNGSDSGKTFIIADTAAVAGGKSALTFLHAQGSAASTSTAGYLADKYLMLKYKAKFTALSAYGDALPVGDEFYNALAAGMVFEATPKDDPKYDRIRQAWLDEEAEVQNLKCTPTEDQARVGARSMPGFDEGEDSADFPEYPIDLES